MAGPPVIETFFSVSVLSLKPTHCPFGDTNGFRTWMLVAITLGSSVSSARTKSCVPLLPMYTTREPSGVIATSRVIPETVIAAGPLGVIMVRVTEDAAGWIITQTPPPTSPTDATPAATSPPTRRQPSLGDGAACAFVAIPSAPCNDVGSLSTNSTVETSLMRCLRSLYRHRLAMVRIVGGTFRGTTSKFGSRANTEA